jgi:glycosyltransferase involved in cell wall biosynthesis
MKRKKNIVIVSNYIPHYNNIFYNDLVRYKSGSINLSIISDQISNSDLNIANSNQNYNVVNNKIRSYFGIIFRYGLIRDLVKLKPDKVIFYGNPRDISVFIGLIFCRIFKIDCYCHGMFHKIGHLKFITRVSYKIMYYLSKGCLTYGSKGATVLYSLGLRSSKIKIIGTAIGQNDIKFNLSKYKTRDLDLFRTNKNLLNKRVILQVVRFSRIKNIQLLIKAAEINKNDDYIYVLIGDGECFDEIFDLIKIKGLDDKFVLLGQLYDEAELAKWFMISDLFVVPSCIGLSLHHAFSYGLPVITDNCIDTQSSESELLYNRINGLNYEAGNASSLASVIKEIIEDNKLRAMLSKNASQTIMANSLEHKTYRYMKSIGL